MSDGQSNVSRELEELKAELRFMQQRLTGISQRVEQLAAQPPPPVKPVTSPPIPAPPVLPPPVPPPLPPTLPAAAAETVSQAIPPVVPPAALPPRLVAPPPPSPPAESFEVRLGTFWLPRVGMALLLIGMVFFAAYWVPRMGVGTKVAMAYLFCAALGGVGIWLDKRMPQLARVIQAGALGLTYFFTYALHHVPALRVIDSAGVDLALLSVVVAGIVVLASWRQSATLGALALFAGYLTTVISDVTAFTLAANAVLAVAALVFLARNRWVIISFGAVLATYLVYVIWAWNANPFELFERFLMASAYLTDADFRLRAGFLSLYWLLFTVGGLLVSRTAMERTERNGLLTLNNAFFFVLFWLLVHHAHPGQQWVFLFVFGGALLVASALAYQRFQPDRLLLDSLFLQGVGVATLGLMSKLQGVNLVAALAVESLFLLWLARAMQLRWIVWIARVVYGFAALFALRELPHWDAPMIYGASSAALAGYLGARLARRDGKISISAIYYALLGTVLAMAAAGEHFARPTRPWAWLVLAVVIGGIGLLLRTRETVWLANLPLAWAHVSFHFGNADLFRYEWTLVQSLALVTVTFVFGLLVWGKARAAGQRAGEALTPYALAAIAALIGATVCQCPTRWRLAALAIQALVLLLAGWRMREPLLQGLAVLPLAWAHVTFFSWNTGKMLYELDQALALIVVTFAFGLILWGRERAEETPAERADVILWPFAIAAVFATVLTTFEFVPREWQLAVFVAQGALLMLSGLPVFVWLALALFGVGLVTFLGTSRYRLGTPSDAWSNLIISWLLLLLSARVLRLRRETLAISVNVQRRLRVTLVSLLTAVALVGLYKLLEQNWLTFGWTMAGFLLLALGFALRERPYRLAGLTLLGFAFARVIIHDWTRLETIYRILSFIGLGVILLVMAFLYTKNRDKIAKWL